MKFNQTFAVLFWIVRNKTNKVGQAPIYTRVTIDGARTELSTRRMLDPQNLDSEKEMVIESDPSASIINNYLAQVQGEIFKHYNMLLATNDRVTVEMIRDSYMAKPKRQEKKTFLNHLDQYLKEREEKVTVGDLSLGRLKKLKVLRTKVTAYMKHKVQIDRDHAE